MDQQQNLTEEDARRFLAQYAPRLVKALNATTTPAELAVLMTTFTAQIDAALGKRSREL